MKNSSILKYFINRPLHMKLLFIVMFILYGAIISVLSYNISNYYQNKITQKKLIKIQKQSFKMKSAVLISKMDRFAYEIKALRKNRLLQDYINDEKKDSIKDLFSLVMNANNEISQLRYIDANGNEKIRFDRNDIGSKALEINSQKLQNKATRYYFKDIKKLKEKQIWYSKLDLNVEHGIIQKPIVPTLRIGTPIYHKGEFQGIIIMNTFFKDIINKFVYSPYFYITIYDKDGAFIHHKHPDDSGKVVDYSWSKYLEKKFNFEMHEKRVKSILENKKIDSYIYKQSISHIIPNKDKLSVYYEAKLLKVKELLQSDKNYIVTVTLIVLLISIPLAFLISLIPSALNDEIYETKKVLEEQLNVVDEYVFLSVTDMNGILLDVSSAYLDLTGYTKEELLGKRHNILRHPNTSSSLYENLWKTILSKKVWSGELTNIRKDGTFFDAKILIKPNLNKKNEIKSFSAYVQDITYQKKIEKMSVTDELTSLYNRREFNKVFKRYISHSQRCEHGFSMIILDIDFFKQYNDTYGHQEGDLALKKVSAKILELTKRESDLGFRLGGEEFGILFTSASEQKAFEFASSLVLSIKNLKIEHKASKIDKYLTVSAGLFHCDRIGNFEENSIYKACDEALYEAKTKGRNQVILYKS